MPLNIPIQPTLKQDPDHLEWDVVIHSDFDETIVREELDASSTCSHPVSLGTTRSTTSDDARSSNLNLVVQMHSSAIEDDMQALAISSPNSVVIDSSNIDVSSENVFVYVPSIQCESTVSSENTISTTVEKTIDQSSVVFDSAHDRANENGFLWKTTAIDIFLKALNQTQSQPGLLDNDSQSDEEEVDPCYPISNYSPAIMWIGFLSKTVAFKDLQRLLYSPDVLHIKYRRSEHFAHVTYCSIEAMNLGIQMFTNTVFHGVILQCYPIQADHQLTHPEYQLISYSLFAMGTDTSHDQIPTEPVCYPPYYPYPPESHKGYPATLAYPTANPYLGPPNGFWYTPYTRYFIMKPWAPQDLNRSLQTGYWSVSRAKMDHLNIVFENTPKVYLIFSITGSGEYYGCAQMVSPVIDIADCCRSGRRHGLVNTPFENKYNKKHKWKSPKTKQKKKSDGAKDDQKQSASLQGQSRNPRSWSFVFALDWIFKCRVPFSDTKQLFNLWSMSLVKESADCTELETGIGEVLMEFFRLQNKKDQEDLEE